MRRVALGRSLIAAVLLLDRSLVVGDRLFTLSCRGIGVSALTDLRAQAWLPFTPASPRACSPALPIPLLH